MLIVGPVMEDFRRKPNEEEMPIMQSEDLMERVIIKVSTVSTITRVDYSAMVQTVSEVYCKFRFRLIRQLLLEQIK